MEFKISCLLFIRNKEDEVLMIRRRKSPNKGRWSPPGGKLDMTCGESPFECAVREAREETGLLLEDRDLALFGYVSEKGYESTTNWLMFLFDCKKLLPSLPPDIEEGRFGFYSRREIDNLEIPPTDHQLVWPLFDKRKEGFWGVRAECHLNRPMKLKIEESPHNGDNDSSNPTP